MKIQCGVALSMDWLGDIPALKSSVVRFDDAGFDHVSTAGHLLTNRLGRYEAFPPPTYSLPYRDPFVFCSYLAAITNRVTFRPGIFILPMFPTALVAKQAADLSLMSGGRFSLGVAISWQEAEYRALGQDFSTRARRLEEQIEVLRMLWTQPLVTFKGRFHDIDEIGIGQLPESPIPIWIGCGPQPKLLRRVVELADGWLPGGASDVAEPVEQIRAIAAEVGRSSVVGVAARVMVGDDLDDVVAQARRQLQGGATEITLALGPGPSDEDGTSALIDARKRLEDADLGV
jgi:probable F420-dependent oxidoreductase